MKSEPEPEPYANHIDMVGDAEGNVYNVGYMKNTIMNWGGPSGLRTKIVDGAFSGPAETLSTPVQTPEDIVTHLYVAKLNAATETMPSCLTSCTDTTATATVDATSCFIDGVCYAAGDTAAAFGKACQVCDPSMSQTEWSAGPTMGTSTCLIDGICWADGDFLFTQSRTRSPKVYSSCKHCSPAADATAWSVAAGFEVVDDKCVSIAPSPPPHAGTFTDDEGTTHTWGATVPKIITGTFQALTLMDMGLPASQIMGTYGERGTDGSNIDGVFATSDSWVTRGHHGDHANAEHERDTHFLSDPSPAEKALLSQMVDVSPECSGTNTWCNKFNATILDIHGWPDIIIAGPLFATIVNDEVKEKAAQRGIPVIILSDKNTAKTEWKSFIDLAERFEDLAKALGADVEAHTAHDKQNFCAKAAEFREISHQASQRGVRALSGYMPFGPADPDTGNIAAMLNAPDRNPALMMLEELGMGIIHLNSRQSSCKPHLARTLGD
jgi:ABC-type Fe3+-hydroxamate transport system substrate-binding protein